MFQNTQVADCYELKVATPEEAADYIESVQQVCEGNTFGIVLQKTGEFIGQVLLVPSLARRRRVLASNGHLGYWLGHEYWNRGYMTEAIKAFLNEVFSHQQFDTIDARIAVNNVPSTRVAQKVGMKEVCKLSVYSPDDFIIWGVQSGM